MVLTHFFTFFVLLRNILSHAIDFFTIYGYNEKNTSRHSMDSLIFYSAVPSPAEEKKEIADKMDYTYHILNFEFPNEHSHTDYWEFTILLDGEINHYLNGKREVYKKGTLFGICC